MSTRSEGFARYLPLGAALWTGAFLCGYLALIHAQGDSSPAWWFVGVLVAAAALLVIGAIGRWSRAAFGAAAALLGVAALLGILSIGLLLMPAVWAAVASIVLTSARKTPLTDNRTLEP